MHRRNIPNYKYNRRKSVVRGSTAKEQAELKRFITEDPDTGLTISTKEPIPDELKSYNEQAYTYPPYVTVSVIVLICFILLFLFF